MSKYVTKHAINKYMRKCLIMRRSLTTRSRSVCESPDILAYNEMDEPRLPNVYFICPDCKEEFRKYYEEPF